MRDEISAARKVEFMRSRWNRWLLLCCGTGVLLLTLSGCFQQVGGDVQSFSAPDIGATFTPSPTDVIPTPEPITIIVTPTIDPFAPVIPTTDPFAAIPTTDPFAQAQVFPTTDPNLGVGGPVEQTGSDVGGFAVQELDPLQITATFIVAGATGTAEAYVTQTAIASGLVFFTPTPPPLLLTPPVTNPTPGVVVSGVDCIHEVRVEDRNLFRISLYYGLDVQQLAAANGLVNPNLIVVGQKLVIPGCGTSGNFPPATSIPTGDLSGQGTGTTGTGTGTVTGAGNVYVVQQGDTLFKISLATGVPVMSIAAANPSITNINLIVIGQQIVIPAS